MQSPIQLHISNEFYIKISAKLLLLLCLPFLPACQHRIQKNLSRVSIGMNKEEVIACLGKSYVNKEAEILENGALFEEIEYRIFTPFIGEKSCFMFFIDGILVKYVSRH